MSDEQPGRVLGQVDRSDQPYDNEIDALAPPAAATETTPLLRSGSHTSNGTVPVAPAFDNSKAAQRRRRPAHSRPALLLILYIIGCILLCELAVTARACGRTRFRRRRAFAVRAGLVTRS